MDERAFVTANEPEITITKKLIFVVFAASTTNMFCCDLCHYILENIIWFSTNRARSNNKCEESVVSRFQLAKELLAISHKKNLEI